VDLAVDSPVNQFPGSPQASLSGPTPVAVCPGSSDSPVSSDTSSLTSWLEHAARWPGLYSSALLLCLSISYTCSKANSE
jgi:hypothetical protein